MRDTAEMEAAGGPDQQPAETPRVTELPVAHPWFRAEDAGGGITRLLRAVRRRPARVSNVWHVPGRDADLLVDSANGIGPLQPHVDAVTRASR